MDRPFMDAAATPNEQSLQVALGGAYAGFRTIVDLAGSFVQDWNFSKGSGWTLKIHDRNKALLYLIPLNESFRISLAMREAERDAFLRDDELAALRDRISSAKRYAEGFALQFDLAGDSDSGPAKLFVGKLVAARS